jgi:transposase
MGRSTRQEWAKRIERWQDSGLTAREFAAEIDVPTSSLTYWKWKLRQERKAAPMGQPPAPVAQPAPAPRFLELVAQPRAPELVAPSLEVVLGSGVVVRVPTQFDDVTLRRVVTLLGGG